MKIKLLEPVYGSKAGTVLDVSSDRARQLIRDKAAEPVDESPKRARRAKGSAIENKSMKGRGVTSGA